MKRLIIIALVLLAIPIDAQEKSAASHYAPVSPAEILKLLPPAPTNWKITSSRASNQVTSWVLTIAQKSLEYTPPPDPAQPNKPPLTMKTSITLIDGGGEPLSGSQFDNFAPGNLGNLEKFVIANCPAILTKAQAGQERLTMSIGQRFLVTLVLENQPPNSAKSWAQMLNIPKFTAAAASTKPMAALPSEVQIELVDELNPKNNRRVVQPIRPASEKK